VQISDSHEVDFWEYGNGDLLVKESLDVDRDFADGRVTLAKMESMGLSMVDMYKNLAGARFDGTVAQQLGAADLRHRERAAARAAQPAGERIDDGVPIQGLSMVSPVTTSLPTAVRQTIGSDERVTSAEACAEPAWDWQGDVGWFKNNFCLSNSKFCSTERAWASYGWFRGPTNFKATGFAQSHCSGARWLFKRRAYGGFPFYGVSEATLANFDLLPRHLDTEHWTTTGDRAWFAKVSSHTGDNRTALAIHHN
jgi:hypothetical protein